jgi:hypothetical protein
MRALAMPRTAVSWSLTSLREKLIKIGAKVVSHGRYVAFQLAAVAVSRQMFAKVLSLIARLQAPPHQHDGLWGRTARITMGRCVTIQAKAARFSASTESIGSFDCILLKNPGLALPKTPKQ